MKKPVHTRWGTTDLRENLVRIEILPTLEPKIDAIENIISNVRLAFKGYKIKTVFGCGGGRDKKKREIMGEIASNLSDFCMVTSDNPRDEEPLEIISDITKGMSGSDV